MFFVSGSIRLCGERWRIPPSAKSKDIRTQRYDANSATRNREGIVGNKIVASGGPRFRGHNPFKWVTNNCNSSVFLSNIIRIFHFREFNLFHSFHSHILLLSVRLSYSQNCLRQTRQAGGRQWLQWYWASGYRPQNTAGPTRRQKAGE